MAQNPLRLSFNHLTREDGLSNNNILFIFTDSRGFTWLSTHNGLNRFDGTHIRVYKPYNSGIKGVRIKTVVEDQDSNLWVGSDEGLNFYNRKTDTFVALPSPTNDSIYAARPIGIDHNNQLWLTCSDKKGTILFTIDVRTKKFRPILTQVSESFATFLNGTPSHITTLYWGMPNESGIHKITIKNYHVIKHEVLFDGKNNLPKLLNIKDYIFIENDSTIWITANPYGLIRFNPNTLTFQYNRHSTDPNEMQINKMVSYQHYLLIGAINGVLIFDKNQRKWLPPLQYHISEPSGISANANETLYLDTYKNLFLSQLGWGIDFTNLNISLADNWFSFADAQKAGFADNHLVFIRKLGDKVCAKKNNGGVLIFDKTGKIIKYYPNKNLLLVDSQEKMLMSDGKQFYVENLKNNTTKIFTNTNLANKMGWQNEGVEIAPHLYLISSAKGLHILNTNTGKWETIEAFNAYKTEANTPLFYDKATNQILVSANWWTKFFIIENKNNKWQIKTIKNWAVYGIRTAIQLHKIWLCTNKGLLLFDTKTFAYQSFTEKDGLPDDAVTDIYEEPNGNYWLVTNKGIAYYNKKRNEYRSYTSKDGVTSKEIDWNCAFKLDDGRMVFGGTDGLSVIGKSTVNTPKVQITELLINEKPAPHKAYVGEAAQIELQPSQNSFALNVVGIDYGAPKKVKIKYQLQGYDQQWVTTNNPATVRYSNVAEGTYQMLVQATDEDGQAYSPLKKLTIIVYAPFYRTIWFRVLLLGLLLALGYLLYRLRIGQIKEKARRLEEIRRIKAEAEVNALRSQMNPHFIFNCLVVVHLWC